MSWGPAYWRFIHYFALNNKDRELFSQLPSFIPCAECKNDWEDPQDGDDLVQWSLKLHNKINKKLGKWDKWDLTDYNIAHKNTCDYCNRQEYIHFFPWMFIHTVAEVGPDTLALEFLQTFNSKYPCEVCHNNFLQICQIMMRPYLNGQLGTILV
jgi:Erv1 / Alr family